MTAPGTHPATVLIVALSARQAGYCASQERLSQTEWRFVSDWRRLSTVGAGARVIRYGRWQDRRDFPALNAAINYARSRGAVVADR